MCVWSENDRDAEGDRVWEWGGAFEHSFFCVGKTRNSQLGSSRLTLPFLLCLPFPLLLSPVSIPFLCHLLPLLHFPIILPTLYLSLFTFFVPSIAGPLALARDILGKDDSPFFVLNSDVICDFPFHDLKAFHEAHGNEGTIVVRWTAEKKYYASACCYVSCIC